MFAGRLAPFGQTLAAPGRPVVPVTALLTDESLDHLLRQVYGAELFASQKPVLVSQWSKYLFMQLIPPVMAASLALQMAWPLERLGFALSERGLPDGVGFHGEPAAVEEVADPFARFAGLLEVLQQMIERLAEYGGVASGVLWGNAGDYLETCLRQLDEAGGGPLAPGYALLQERLKPDGRRNPLFNAIAYIEGPDGQTVRQRRSCCLSHRVEWVGRCEHCPLG